MRLTIQLKLQPTLAQADALLRTLTTANAACNYISQVAWESHTFRQFAIHRLTYQSVRESFGLAAQLAVRCIAKVADAYKLDRETLRTFAQLRTFIEYKARLKGVPVHLVDPRNTSRTCPNCGCVDKSNRPTQAHFSCTFCGFAGSADVIAAVNIGRRVPVSVPYCSDADASTSVAPGQSSTP